MSVLINFLRENNGDLGLLESTYHIKTSSHHRYPNLTLFKYDHSRSPFHERIVQESRGIILDRDRDWAIVCLRFSKFFNYSETLAAPIDWRSARVQEKLDGSLMTLYHYDSDWHVASSGTPDASGYVVSGLDMSFADLFWKTFSEMGLKLPSRTDWCYSFELTSPYNQIVVRYPTSKLTMIGIFDRAGHREIPLSLELEESHGFPVVKSYELTRLDAVLDSFEEIDPTSQEGYVVVDGSCNRIKIKHPRYVLLHHTRGSGRVDREQIVMIILSGETSEFLSYHPELDDEVYRYVERYSSLLQWIQNKYVELSPTLDPKRFAHAVKAINYPFRSVFFSLRQGKISHASEYLKSLSSKQLVQMLDLDLK